MSDIKSLISAMRTMQAIAEWQLAADILTEFHDDKDAAKAAAFAALGHGLNSTDGDHIAYLIDQCWLERQPRQQSS